MSDSAEATERPLVLASSSPRRQQMLRDAGFELILAPPQGVDETPLPDECPIKLVERLASAKAAAVAPTYPNHWVLGSDTIVHFAGEPLGKPADMAAARHLLQRLAGQTHEVITGVCLRCLQADESHCWSSTSRVTFNPLSTAEIDLALTLTNPLDKAGGYAIQEQEEVLIASYTGWRSTIIGLPIEEVVARWSALRSRNRHA